MTMFCRTCDINYAADGWTQCYSCLLDDARKATNARDAEITRLREENERLLRQVQDQRLAMRRALELHQETTNKLRFWLELEPAQPTQD